MARVQPYLKVAGLAVTLTTGNVLLAAPGSASQSVKPLEPLGGTQQMQFTLLWEDNIAGGLARDAVRLLASGTQEAVRSSDGGYARLTGYVSASATTLPVSDSSVFSTGAGAFYTFDGETVRVDAAPTSTTLTVTRAQRNSRARVHTVVGLGPVFYSGFGSAIGAEVEYGQTVDSVDEPIWYGFISGVSVSGSTVTLTCRDVLAQTRDRYQYPLAAVGSGRFQSVTQNRSRIRLSDLYWRSNISADALGRSGLLVDQATFSSGITPATGGWTYARLKGGDDEWIVVPVEYTGTETIVTDTGDVTFSAYTPEFTSDTSTFTWEPDLVLAVGKGDETLRYSDPSEFAAHILRVCGDTFTAEYALVYDNGNTTLADIVGDAIYGRSDSALPVYGMKLPASWVDTDSIDALDAVLPGLISNCEDPDKFVMPPLSEGSAIENIAREFLGPLFLSLTTGTDGRIRVIDWAAYSVPGSSYGISDALNVEWQMSTEDRLSLPMVWFARGVTTHRIDRQTVTEFRQFSNSYVPGRLVSWTVATRQQVKDYYVVVSETAPFDTLTEAPKAIPVNALIDSMDDIAARAQIVVNRYSVGVPSVMLSLDSTQDYDVGDLLLVNRGDLPNNSGARSASLLLCIVTEAQRNVGLSGAGSRNIKALVVNWHNGSESWGVWCPCAGVTAWSAPTATVAANILGVSGPYGTDAAAFAAMLAHAGGSLPVEILDGTLAFKGSGTLTGRSGNTLDITTAVTPVSGDVVVPADWTSQGAGAQAEPWAFGADAGGVLGTSDSPKRYRGRA